jgi:inner membrane protein
MSQSFTLPRLPRRSMGLKLLLVCGLALVMSIPALFVFALLSDRTHRAEEVTREISGLVGGPQTFMGPVLAVPYTLPSPAKDQTVENGVFVVFPVSGQASVTSKSEVRQRSLFKVPVYRADIGFAANFDLKDAAARAPKNATLDWTRAEFLLGASDARGALADVALAVAGQARPVAPASVLTTAGVKRSESETTSAAFDRGAMTNANLKLFGASATGVSADAPFQVTASMRFSGAQRFDLLPFAKTTRFEAHGDWASPSFDGGFLPTARTVTANGFTASWNVPFLARGVPAQGDYDLISALGPTAPGVSFVEPANPYQSVARSLKYALMFVGLVFLAYFIFETTQKRRVHPAQYVLIGLAQIVFYLLLLSIAEQIGFDLAFLVAAGATVGLISAYAGWVFESRRQGFVALVAFSLLYGLIYILMRLEDLALLVGALASFAAIAAVMYVTRRLDWYGAPAPDAGPALASKEAS